MHIIFITPFSTFNSHVKTISQKMYTKDFSVTKSIWIIALLALLKTSKNNNISFMTLLHDFELTNCSTFSSLFFQTQSNYQKNVSKGHSDKDAMPSPKWTMDSSINQGITENPRIG